MVVWWRPGRDPPPNTISSAALALPLGTVVVSAEKGLHQVVVYDLLVQQLGIVRPMLQSKWHYGKQHICTITFQMKITQIRELHYYLLNILIS